jgi:hypothetical protein
LIEVAARAVCGMLYLAMPWLDMVLCFLAAPIRAWSDKGGPVYVGRVNAASVGQQGKQIEYGLN